MQEDLLFCIEHTETPTLLFEFPQSYLAAFAAQQIPDDTTYRLSVFANQQAATLFLLRVGHQTLPLPFFIPTNSLCEIVTKLQEQSIIEQPIQYQLQQGELVLHNRIKRVYSEKEGVFSFMVLIYPDATLTGWSNYYEILRYMIEATPDGILIAKNDAAQAYPVVFCNKHAQVSTGGSLMEALLQQNWMFSQRLEKQQELQHELQASLLAQKGGTWLMHRYQDPNNSELFEWREVKILPILDALHRFEYWLCIFSDVTERLRSEYVLRSLFKGLVGGVLLDSSGANFFATLAKNLVKYLRVSWVTIAIKQDAHTLQTLAACKGDKLLKNYSIALKNNPAKTVLERHSVYVDNLVEMAPELAFCNKEKPFTHYLGICLYDSQSKPIGVLEAMHHRPFDDLKITEYVMGIFSTRIASEWERIQTYKGLEEARSNLLAAMESNQDYMLSVDEERQRLLANSSFLSDAPQLFGTHISLGASLTAICAKSPQQVIRQEWLESLNRAFEGERFIKEFQLQLYEKQVYLDIAFNPIFDEQGNVRSIGIFSRDVTYKRRAEAILRNNEAQLTALLENSDDVIYLLDQNLTVLVANMAAKNFYKNVFEYDLRVGKKWNVTNEASSNNLAEWYQAYAQALNGKRLIKEFEFNHASYKHIEVAFNPVYAQQGHIIGVSVLARNITERKIYENELKVRNFELDSFVYRASHDLRAPLCSVQGLIMLMKNENQQPDLDNYLHMMAKSIAKLDDFISELISFSRNERTPVEVEQIDFESIIQEIWQEMQYMSGADKIQLQVQVNTPYPFFSDKSRLKSIFQNLLSNSIKYQKTSPSQEAYVAIKVQTDAHFAYIEVTDNGIGIESRYLPRIFDMFFRASANSQGSGLGLYITKQIVHKLKGVIMVSSELKKGTSFFIQLPHLHKR